jgi:NAD(P)-dependent dehydrogenase (short-subunit alcohol dehydrogenase family)
MSAIDNEDCIIPYRVISITDKIHNTSYPAISPSRPALSQAGRTVLITGGSGGIGYGIALAFAAAGAEKVIIVGRDEAKQKSSALSLAQEAGPKSHTKFEGRAASPTSPETIDNLWNTLEAEGIYVDVLVLNAAVTGCATSETMWNTGWESTWETFIVHVRSVNHYSERFYKQTGDKKVSLRYPMLTYASFFLEERLIH